MKKSIILFSVLFLFNSCTKDDNRNENPEDQNTEVKENVVVISEENSQIISSETDIVNGIYSIEFSENIPEITTSDVIVGDQGEGFLRKVTSVSIDGNIVTMQTSQANMEDVFNVAIVEFNTDLSNSARMSSSNSVEYSVNYLAEGVQFSGNGIEFDFSNTVLYQQGALTFEITDGTATFNPNFSFKGDYSLFGGLDYLDFKATNAELNIDLDVSLNASASVNLPELSRTLADVEKKLKFFVGGVPVVVVVNTKLVAELNTSIDSSFDITTGLTNNFLLSASTVYENDNWTGDFDLSPILTPKPVTIEGEANIAQNLTITPKVSVKFYGVIGPYCQPKMTEDFVFNIASPSLDWDSNLKAGLDVTTGVDITIFGYDAADFSRTDSFEETVWNAPENLVIVNDESSNNQTGEQGEQLSEPLKVLVKDKLDNALPLVPVYFEVIQGNGTVNNDSVMTDENGFAEVFWTLGNNTDQQTVEVTVKKADGTNIESSLIFNATANISEELIIGTWHANSVLFNGTEIFDPLCYEALVFTDSNFTAQDLGDCDTPQATGGDYSISGNTLNLNFTTGDFTGSISQQLLELTETSLVVAEGNEYVYSYTKQEVDIFGEWTITETSTCDSTSGNTSNDNYSGPITLNTDFTVTMENDSNGNYLTNNFTFSNNILTINLSYQDFFTPNCGGVNYQIITDSFIYIYNESDDSFTGTSQTEKNEIIGSGCIEYGSICNGTGTIAR